MDPEEGPPKPKRPRIVKSHEVIKILSAEGKCFYINRDVVMISKHLAAILTSTSISLIFIGGFKEGESRQISLQIKTDILETCLKYLHYKLIYRSVSFERPPFPIGAEQALDVLKASIYLQC